MRDTIISVNRHAPRKTTAAGTIARLMLSVVGVALMVSSLGLWAMSPDGYEPGMDMIRLAVSLFMAGAGVACILCATAGRSKADAPDSQGLRIRPAQQTSEA